MQFAGAGDGYASPWVEVEILAGHEPRIRVPSAAVGALIEDAERARVLVVWRHRFIVDRRGFEVPAGAMEPGESIEECARRETLEEVGWHLVGVRPLLTYQADPELGAQLLHIVTATIGARGDVPPNGDEGAGHEWLDRSQAASALRTGRVFDGLTQIALSHWLLTAPGHASERTTR